MKYFFVSDTHLGLDIDMRGEKRKERFISFLASIHEQAGEHGGEIFLLGDIFDFWFESGDNVPEGFDGVISQIRKITSEGVKVHFFKGNHDMWTYGYLARECGMQVYDGVKTFTLEGKRFHIGHGDYLGVNLWRYPLYALMHTIFNSKVAYNIFRAIVPYRVIMNFGKGWSSHSRKSKSLTHQFRAEREPIVSYCRKYLKKHSDIDYFVFGHLHCKTEYDLGNNTTLIILGEWVKGSTYLSYDGESVPTLIEF